MPTTITLDNQPVHNLDIGEEIYVKWRQWERMNTTTTAYSSVERLEDGTIPGKKGQGKRYKAFKTDDSLSGTAYCDYFRTLDQAMTAAGIPVNTPMKRHGKNLIIPVEQQMGD